MAKKKCQGNSVFTLKIKSRKMERNGENRRNKELFEKIVHQEFLATPIYEKKSLRTAKPIRYGDWRDMCRSLRWGWRSAANSRLHKSGISWSIFMFDFQHIHGFVSIPLSSFHQSQNIFKFSLALSFFDEAF